MRIKIKKTKQGWLRKTVISFVLVFICGMSPSVFAEDASYPAWSPNTGHGKFDVAPIGGQCGPTSNEQCLSCHDLNDNAPDPNIRMIVEPTHGKGVYRLSAEEYLSINMHTFSKYLKPKCTACHFNPKISKAELKGFKYAKMGDRICYTCHQDKAPDKYKNSDTLMVERNSQPQKNLIMEDLKRQFFAKRASVAAYRKRLKLD